MALDFPLAPINGQTFTAPNGIIYTYQTPPGRWNDTGGDDDGGGSGGPATPTGPAGGDLMGDYPNPEINPEVIDDRVNGLLVAGSNITLSYSDAGDSLIIASTATGGGGTGTVTDVTVTSANGLAGSVVNGSTTPAITLSTTIDGLLKGNAGAVQMASPVTDYLTPLNAAGLYLLKTGGTLTGDVTFRRFIGDNTILDSAGVASGIQIYATGTGNRNSIGASAGSFDLRSTGAYNFYWGAGATAPNHLATLDSTALQLDVPLTAPSAILSAGPTYPNDSNLVATTAFVTDAVAAGGGGGISEAPIDTNVYGRKDAGWTEIVDISSGTYQNYLFNAGTTPPPALGSVRFNNVSQNSVNGIYFSFTTNDTNAVNLETYWVQRVKVGDFFYFQDKDDPLKWKLFELVAPYTDSGNYASMSVVWRAGGNDLTAGRIIVTREGASVATPIGEAPNDGLPYVRKSLGWDDFTNDMALKANVAAPTFTGDAKAVTPTFPDNDTSIATTAYVTTAVSVIEQNLQSGTYTTVLADAGKHIYRPGGSATATLTIAANASVAYPTGTTITFVNISANAATIATSDTLLWSPTLATGSRTLGSGGVATAIKLAATTWVVSGTALT